MEIDPILRLAGVITESGISRNATLLLTKREAAARARVSERTFDRVLASGTGPAITRIGARVLIREDHMGAWIDRCTEAPPGHL
jgi:predicted DNA-binding transcriptional regulator AlpA